MDAATHTGVDEVRELQELLRFHPTRDRFRVIIVDEVHMLSKSAFNALLKTIEEPPPYILWIFATTDRLKVPATIQSRCQQLEFRPVGSELIRVRLEEIAASEDFALTPSAAASIASAAEGSVRDALSLLDQLRAFASDDVDDEAVALVLGVPPIEVTVQLVNALAAGRVAEGLTLVRDQLANGQDASVLYREIGRTLRGALYLAVDPTLAPTMSETHRDLLLAVAESRGVDPLSRMLGLWLEQETLVRGATNRELALEVASLRLARWPSVQQVEEWLAGPGPVDSGSGPSGLQSSSGPTKSSPDTSAAPGSASAAEAQEKEPSTEATEEPPSLAEEASADPGVILATRVLGGEVVAVRSNGEGS
jgi:DNA polymerase-3 subunit gamma/tau